MSDKLPDIPPPPGKSERDDDLFSELLERGRCPMCHIDLEKKVHDQWVRTYDGRELWLTDVHFLRCPKCRAEVYPQDTLDYFDRARLGEIPNLKSRVLVPPTFDD